jgi:excisionase family DNA binding protein
MGNEHRDVTFVPQGTCDSSEEADGRSGRDDRAEEGLVTMRGREVTVAQAAHIYGIGRSTVNKWCHDGTLRSARRIGESARGAWLIELSEFETPYIRERIDLAKRHMALRTRRATCRSRT